MSDTRLRELEREWAVEAPDPMEAYRARARFGKKEAAWLGLLEAGLVVPGFRVRFAAEPPPNIGYGKRGVWEVLAVSAADDRIHLGLVGKLGGVLADARRPRETRFSVQLGQCLYDCKCEEVSSCVRTLARVYALFDPYDEVEAKIQAAKVKRYQLVHFERRPYSVEITTASGEKRPWNLYKGVHTLIGYVEGKNRREAQAAAKRLWPKREIRFSPKPVPWRLYSPGRHMKNLELNQEKN